MKDNYIIVLFKNKKKRKIIKRFVTEKKAKDCFKQLLTKNKKIIFEKTIENAILSQYQIALLTNQTNVQKTLHYVDSMGRNIIANLENTNYVFLEIENYKIEEKIFDWQKQKKITIEELEKIYFNKKDLKNVFTLNNKLCIQIDDDVSVFSLKDSSESDRLLFLLEEKFMSEGKNDCFFVRDVSNAQRKWIYEIMESKGFDKKRLYRLKTTFSKR